MRQIWRNKHNFYCCHGKITISKLAWFWAVQNKISNSNVLEGRYLLALVSRCSREISVFQVFMGRSCFQLGPWTNGSATSLLNHNVSLQKRSFDLCTRWHCHCARTVSWEIRAHLLSGQSESNSVIMIKFKEEVASDRGIEWLLITFNWKKARSRMNSHGQIEPATMANCNLSAHNA